MQRFKLFRITDHTILLFGVVTTFLGHVDSKITTEAAHSIQLNNVIDFTTSEISVDTIFTDQLKNTTKKMLKAALNVDDLKTEILPKEKELGGRRNTSTAAPYTTSMIPLYRIDSSKGVACILLRVDAIIAFSYITKVGERMESDIYVPDRVDISGDCSKADDAKLVMKWRRGFELNWHLSKTLDGDTWYIEQIKLQYDTADRLFEHIKRPERGVLTATHTHGTLLSAPVGKSLTCKGEVTIKLTNSTTHITAELYLRDFQIQPFLFKNEFGPECPCFAVGTGSYRDETMPLIVGSVLVAACLCTITGYGIFRFLKTREFNMRLK